MSGLSLPEPKTPADLAQEAGVSEAAWGHIGQLLATHQSRQKRQLYADFVAHEVVDFLLTHVYAPGEEDRPGQGIWSDRFHAVYMRYHQRIFTCALHPRPGVKLGYGGVLLGPRRTVCDVYGGTHRLDSEVPRLLTDWLGNKELLSVREIPEVLYQQAWRATGPAKERRREQVLLANELFGKVVTVLRSPVALATVQGGLSLLGAVAPKNFKDIVPFARQTIDEGQRVVRPHLRQVEELRQDMLRREMGFIETMLAD